jgi:predicted membrane-bound spermidine synthase
MPRSAPSRLAFYVLFTVSGFAGLIYESIWTQYLKLFLGHAAYAQSLVLAVFMGGMAAGAAWCARRSSRLANPLAAYAAVEAIIGLASLAFHPLFATLTDWAYDSLLPGLGQEWLALCAKLLLSCALILPQSVLLGMTFPLMSAGLARAHRGSAGESLAMLYFTNSLGAAAGVLASGFVLIDQFGLPGTLLAAACLNLAIALVVWLLARPARHEPVRETPDAETGLHLLLAVAFFTGLASFIYEISWIRMLSLVLGASTHSFEVMLATFIFGLAMGGLAVRRRVDASAEPVRLLAWVQVAMGLAAAATLPVYDSTFGLMEALLKGLARTDAGYLLFNLSGAGIAALVMLPATFCAGMTLPLITGALLRRGAGEQAIGQVYAANTLGAIAGVLLAVHAGLPLIGLKGTLLAGAIVDVALGLALLNFLALRKSLVYAGATCAALIVAIMLGVQLDAHKMTAGVFRHGDIGPSRDASILFNKDGKTATVHLVKYPEAVSLRTNGKSDGSINLDPGGERGTDEITMVLTAALPLALKPETRSAAVIGIGTGLTTHTLLQSLDVERVETVEIESAMAEASRGFMPRNSAAFADPRGTIFIDDAKSFFSTHHSRYDLIISEPSNPWVSGVSGLFTREFYRRIRKHLNSGGLLVQWIQLYEMDASLVATVLGALGAEFPHLRGVRAQRLRPADHGGRRADPRAAAGARVRAARRGERAVDGARPHGGRPGRALPRQPRDARAAVRELCHARELGLRTGARPQRRAPSLHGKKRHRRGRPAQRGGAATRDARAGEPQARGQSALPGRVRLRARGKHAPRLVRARFPAAPARTGAGSGAARPAEGPRAGEAAPDRVPRAARARHLAAQRDPRRQGDQSLPRAGRRRRGVGPNRRQRLLSYLQDYQRRWLALFQAVGARNAARMAEIAASLLGEQQTLVSDAREYLLLSALTGYVASGAKPKALELWGSYSPSVRVTRPAFRLLRCHADPAGCGKAFRAYAER